jgi:hypothetical protein
MLTNPMLVEEVEDKKFKEDKKSISSLSPSP